MVDFAIKASIPQEIKTYASEDGGATNVDTTIYSLRYIMEAYTKDEGTLAYRGYLTIPDHFTTSVANFNVHLLAKTYDFVFWADFVLKSAPNKDLYYQTCKNLNTDQDDEFFKTDSTLVGDGLKDIKMVSFVNTTADYGLSNDARDAYFAVLHNIDLSTSYQMPNGETVNLQRPFGKYRLVATDAPKDNGFEQGDSVTIIYTNTEVPYRFNAVNDTIYPDLMELKTYTAPSSVETLMTVDGTDYQNVYVLAFDYIFVPAGTGSSVSFKATAHNIDWDISSVPVQRNKLTTVIGNFFSGSDNATVVSP